MGRSLNCRIEGLYERGNSVVELNSMTILLGSKRCDQDAQGGWTHAALERYITFRQHRKMKEIA
jgi:hypothetical protein